MFRDGFDPFGFDGGDEAAPQAGGLDEFGGDDPVRWFPGEGGAGEDREAGAAGAKVFGQGAAAAFAFGRSRAGGGKDHLHADMGQQSAKERGVNHGTFGR